MTGIYQHIKYIMLHEPLPHTVIEIGANTGLDTQRIYNIAKPCSYYVFEPNPVSITTFKMSNIAKHVHLEECAVGAIDGTITFNQCDCIHPVNHTRFTGASSILEPSDILLTKHPWIKMTSKITVPICKLDTFTATHNITQPITFIWCDAQGAEGQIIQGALKTLERTKYFYFEFFEQEMYQGCLVLDEILKLLPGWKIIEKYAGDILMKNVL